MNLPLKNYSLLIPFLSWKLLLPSSHNFRSSRAAVFLGKGVLKICNKFTGTHPCQSVISIKLQSNCIKITLRHGCSSVNLLHILRALFRNNTSGRLLVQFLKFFHKTYININKIKVNMRWTVNNIFWTLVLNQHPVEKRFFFISDA